VDPIFLVLSFTFFIVSYVNPARQLCIWDHSPDANTAAIAIPSAASGWRTFWRAFTSGSKIGKISANEYILRRIYGQGLFESQIMASNRFV
jgi:hypothetical protein